MATAICTTCNNPLHYRNTRGTRLAEMRCGCGGRLAAATWTEAGYIVRQSRPGKSTAGRRKAVCAICGRVALASTRAEAITVRFSLIWEWTTRLTIEADDPVCNHHRLGALGGLHPCDFDDETRRWLTGADSTPF